MIATCFDDLEEVLYYIAQLDNVDASDRYGNYLVAGKLLDTLGARIGQSRRLTGAIPLLYFGWDDDDNALGWGEDDDELTGGSWYEDGQSLTADAVMDDATYRVAIRMRRDKNQIKVINLEAFITEFLRIFPDAPSLGTYALTRTVLSMVILVGLGRKPTQLEIALFRYSGAFPKPVGIEIGGYWWQTGTPTFAWDDDPDPDAAGWGEESDPTAGGVFAEEF
jgi:hypothetical protein